MDVVLATVRSDGMRLVRGELRLAGSNGAGHRWTAAGTFAGAHRCTRDTGSQHLAGNIFTLLYGRRAMVALWFVMFVMVVFLVVMMVLAAGR